MLSGIASGFVWTPGALFFHTWAAMRITTRLMMNRNEAAWRFFLNVGIRARPASRHTRIECRQRDARRLDRSSRFCAAAVCQDEDASQPRTFLNPRTRARRRWCRKVIQITKSPAAIPAAIKKIHPGEQNIFGYSTMDRAVLTHCYPKDRVLLLRHDCGRSK